MFDEFNKNENNENNENRTTQAPQQTTNEANSREYNFWVEKRENLEEYNITNSINSTPPINTQQDKSYYNQDDIPMNDEEFYNKIKKRENKAKKFFKSALLALIFGIFVGIGFQGFQIAYKALFPQAIQAFKHNEGLNNSIFGNNKIELTTVDEIETKLTTDISGVVESTMSSIVSINITKKEIINRGFWGGSFEQEVNGNGSGIIVKLTDEELLIVTNNHVVSGATNLQVIFIDETEVEAKVKGMNSNEDLAVISVDTKNLSSETLDSIKVAVLGDSDKVKVGQMAIAIGNAMGYGQSVTAGYISAKNRIVEVDGIKMTLLQTDAAINPGNSGGALLNINGEVIGINVVKYGGNSVEGMGYAIPISSAMPIINDLVSKEFVKESEKGFIGVGGEDVTEDISNQLNIPMGVYVTNIITDSPAMKAGLYIGDVITAINGVQVIEFEEMRNIISGYKAGTVIEITIERSLRGVFSEKTLSVTLDKRPE